MKKSLLLSSIATMAIFGSLVIGGTYALFTSESTTTISVTSGTVNVLASVTDLTLFSNDAIQEGAFINGGTATLEKGNLNISYITPGDKVTCNITLENKSNVNILYRVGYVCDTTLATNKEDSEFLFNGLNIDFNGVKKNGFISYKSKYIRLPANAKIDALPLSVELPKESGNEYQEKSTSIRFVVEALQGNAQVTNEEEIKYYIPATAVEATSYNDIKKAIASGNHEISLSSDIIVGSPEQVIDIIDAKDDLSIFGNGHEIVTDKDRIVNVGSASDGIKIDIKDMKLSTQKTIAYDRSVSVYNTKNVTINLSNCDLGASHYALNIAGLAEGAVVNADRCVLSGYAAMQSHSKMTGTFTNCDLYGINKFEFGDGWNDFSTIVFNDKLSDTNGTSGTSAKFENCNIYALTLVDKNGLTNKQTFLSVRDSGVSVTLNNNKFFTAFGVSSIENPTYKELTKKEEIVNLLEYYEGITNSSILLNGEELIK